MKRVVVITGATSGLGQALKHKLEQDGDIVYALSLNNDANESNYIHCDITNEEQIVSALSQVVEKHGKIDILVNNAGYGLFGCTELLPTDEVKRQLYTNFMGMYMMTKHAIPNMSSGAKIVNISSTCALFPLPYRNIYCASKSAVSSFSDCLKMELKPLGIDITSVCPGEIKTPFIKNRVKVFDTNERYGERIKNACGTVENNNDNRMELDYAVGKLHKIVNKKKYKPMYIIGTKYKFLYYVSKFLPKSWYLSIVEKHFGGHN
ncbi:MAG: SDR family NAD(P)-dependent oxidoreductase [Clostridiales bacterium]|nr:SDR family NAD(P)-dependent oxidoreductase [Candidatus Apopatousia equi]